MEKSSNLIINKSIHLANINFNGFSTSSTWIGYFEETETAEPLMGIKLACELFYNFFSSDLEDFILISALCFDDKADLDPRFNIYNDIYEISKEKGYLKPLTDSYIEYLDDAPLLAKHLSIHFDKDFFMPFCEMVMALSYSKVVGQVCFLVNPKLQIALYPHDDTGFGVISLNEDYSIGIKFLQYCGKSEYFNYYIESSIVK
ncbi:hypothetical protein EDC44_12815 [Cricetibacter osteomyelitidis]|uniref:DUF3885 domain-containing protein n=1 Tax=Cricetibacter osteomyelitidis TaxID=1521931 RepID=A0A4R2TBA1_9PAST|nr:hypothetical protein [Cricetibacter osteomyelitidis]TCP92062.1 hypothetical protein EDC44_12815 [Cricetibacter osteomyelitidis]